MLDDEQRDAALVEAPDQIDRLVDLRLGQARCRLVEQEHARLRDDRGRDHQALLVEHREFGRGPVELVFGDADELQRFGRLTPALGAVVRTAAVGRAEDHVVERRQRVEGGFLLEGAREAEAADPVGAHALNLLPLEDDAARIRREGYGRDDVEQRALAAAVGAGNPEYLALFNG